MQPQSVLTLDRPTADTSLEQALLTGWLDRHDDVQLAAVLRVHPGDAADLRDWIEGKPRTRRPARATERREAIAESIGHTRNRTRQPGRRGQVVAR